MKIDELRKEIDIVDGEILKLFEKRMDIAEKIAEYKTENDLPVYDQNRENEKLLKVKTSADKKYESDDISLFTEIMRISREHQTRIIGK